MYCREIKDSVLISGQVRKMDGASFHWEVWKSAFICWLLGGFPLVLTEKRDLK